MASWAEEVVATLLTVPETQVVERSPALRLLSWLVNATSAEGVLLLATIGLLWLVVIAVLLMVVVTWQSGRCVVSCIGRVVALSSRMNRLFRRDYITTTPIVEQPSEDAITGRHPTRHFRDAIGAPVQVEALSDQELGIVPAREAENPVVPRCRRQRRQR